MSAHTEDVEELSYGPENHMTKSAFINNDRTHSTRRIGTPENEAEVSCEAGRLVNGETTVN